MARGTSLGQLIEDLRSEVGQPIAAKLGQEHKGCAN